ncbi:hypothetical protein NBH00_05135 [Paraconexibacter antarcticus]|uniref:Uncharacterized protein n=1 Tax=Paraconexibacter antarcticus TaxID=2949664 RepID=A0ABY5DXC6_9ACTN|nr:hypothetical protein [Paraconexibacter antarcticus]UTI65594.1 hypothetical protein NBH00_05135 [Paraconexibacter antarcticus]
MTPVKVRTVGLSNKLYGAIVALIAGFVLLLAGERSTGLTVIVGALGTLGIGVGMPADRQTRA